MNLRTKLFVKESLTPDGSVDSKRVSAICEYIDQNTSTTSKLPELRAYMKALKPIIAREEAKIETSGEISDETFSEIEKFLLKETGRKKIRLNKLINKDLLGGIRITCADKIWEFTTQSAIETLRPKNRQNI